MKTRYFHLIAWLSMFAVSTGFSQEPASPAGEANDAASDKLRRLLDGSIEWFEFSAGNDATDVLKPHIALRWTNNARSSVDGLTVVWISPQGRAEAIAAIYPFENLFCLEFDSLSRTSFKATLRGQPFWAPEQPGMQFSPIEGAPPPANSQAGRRLQMNQLAREFEATMLGWSAKVNQREELRLLPRPIYRYKMESPAEVLDGALFAFTSGTDPEAIVAIEAVGREGQYQWMYAFVRRTSGGLEARRGDRVVWQVPAYPDGSNPRATHRGHRQPLAPLLAEQE